MVDEWWKIRSSKSSFRQHFALQVFPTFLSTLVPIQGEIRDLCCVPSAGSWKRRECSQENEAKTKFRFAFCLPFIGPLRVRGTQPLRQFQPIIYPPAPTLVTSFPTSNSSCARQAINNFNVPVAPLIALSFPIPIPASAVVGRLLSSTKLEAGTEAEEVYPRYQQH